MRSVVYKFSDSSKSGQRNNSNGGSDREDDGSNDYDDDDDDDDDRPKIVGGRSARIDEYTTAEESNPNALFAESVEAATRTLKKCATWTAGSRSGSRSGVGNSLAASRAADSRTTTGASRLSRLSCAFATQLLAHFGAFLQRLLLKIKSCEKRARRRILLQRQQVRWS